MARTAGVSPWATMKNTALFVVLSLLWSTVQVLTKRDRRRISIAAPASTHVPASRGESNNSSSPRKTKKKVLRKKVISSWNELM